MIHKVHIRHIKSVLLLLSVVILFSLLTYFFLHDEISNAKTYIDHLYFVMMTSTTVAYGDMTPTTQRARLIMTAYVFVFLYLLIYTNFINVD
jgi:prepilin signal peptidase PulO-like enzyme (type II secretory pathway)